MNIFKSADIDLNFIDKVLSYLRDNIDKDITFKNIIDDLDVTKVVIKFDDKSDLILDYVNEKSWETNYYLSSCLTYLALNGYIYSPEQNHFKITYKGIIKLKITSFSEEGFQSKWGKPKDFYLFIIAVLSLLIALFGIIC